MSCSLKHVNEKIKCDKCSVRISRTRQNLVCDICKRVKHYKCCNLSKNDVNEILRTQENRWTCYECISDVLPMGIAETSDNSVSWTPITDLNFKQRCSACDGMSYRRENVEICTWCNDWCHKKCLKSSLGCLKCCDNMIPGYKCYAFELLDNKNYENAKLFNPYDQKNLINSIGDQIRSTEESSEIWDEISEKLVRCTYITPKQVSSPKDNELSVLSMNIRSIHKNIERINDSITEYTCYDVINLNETSCNILKLANGLDDLQIEGFYPPVYQAPARKSCRGGGPLTYVNKRVCSSAEDIQNVN